MLVQNTMAAFQAEQHEPNEGLPGRTTQRLSGAGFKRSNPLVVVAGSAGSQRGVGQGNFHQQQRTLSMVVAGAHIPGAGAREGAGRRILVDGLELQETGLEVAKVV